MKKIFLLGSVLGLLLLSGCATIFSGGDDTINIDSTPAGASVFIDGRNVGVTPFSVEVERSTFNTKGITIKKKGYKTYNFDLKKTFNGVAIFNFVGLSSWATDAATGSIVKYAPNSYSVDLIKE